MKKRNYLLVVTCFCSIFTIAQNIGIGTTTPASSAQLEVSSTTRGFLMPRMSQAQINAIPFPAKGLMVYNTEDNCVHTFNGQSWTKHCGLTPSPDQTAVLPPGTWSKLASMPSRNSAEICVGFSIDNALYLATQSTNPDQNEFWQYNTTTNTWLRRADFPGGGRVGPVALSIGSKGYLGLGFSLAGGENNDWWEYDPGSNTWIRRANFPGLARRYAAGFGIGSKGYVCGGSEQSFVPRSETYQYDPILNSWTQKANMPSPLAGHLAVANANGNAYVGLRTTSWFEYNPSTNVWTTKAEFPGVARQLASGFSVGSEVYAGFGQGGVFLDFFKYTVSSNTWQRLDDFEGPARYGAVGYSVQDGGIVLAGTGFEPGVGPTNLPDAWRFSAVTGTGALLRAAGLPSNVGVEAAGWIKAGSQIYANVSGNVGIGTSLPSAKLHIAGGLRLVNGTEGLGKVLTSNADGLATWESLPPAPATLWSQSGNSISSTNSGNVGIGVSFPPQSKLVVIGNATIGSQNSANGANALATGFFTFASGSNSFSGGSYSIASAENTLAFGNSSEASAINAAAIGLAIRVNVPHSFGVGSYNSIEDENTPSQNQRVFQVGNGVASNIRRNAFTVLRNGNVGIGVDAPDAQLQFANTTVNRKIVLWEGANNDHQFYGFGINGGTLRYQTDALGADHVFFAGANATTSNELLRIKGNGNVGINQANPQVPLQFATALGKKISLYRGGTGDAGFGVFGNELRIHSDYNGADITFGYDNLVNGFTERFRVQANGNATLAGVLTQNSDETLKKNIEPIANASHLLQQLHGYRYQWKDENADAEKQLGLLAQEVQKVLPELVKEGENGKLGVNYSGLIPVLLEALKEQRSEIDQLKALVKQLINTRQ